MEEQRTVDVQQRWRELRRETEQAFNDVASGRVSVKECRAKQRELGKRLKTLEQELETDAR
jgi:hypothetical protein